MGFLSLLISILAESSGKTVDKLNFKRNHTTPRQYIYLVFLGMTASLLLYIVVTWQHLPHFSPIVLGLTVLVALFSFGSNIFDCLSLKVNDLSLREPLVDFEPIAAGLAAYAIFPAERKPAFLMAFILGAFIVNWGVHRRKLRKFQAKGIFYLSIAVVLEAFLPSLYKESLHYMSPVYIAFFRFASVLVLSTIFFPMKSIKGITTSKVWYGFIAGVIYTVGAVASIYAIKILGVVLTMLFLMLGPSLRYLSGYFILKEKVRKGEVISSLLLASVVVVASIIQ
jgi:hypothetical protein